MHPFEFKGIGNFQIGEANLPYVELTNWCSLAIGLNAREIPEDF